MTIRTKIVWLGAVAPLLVLAMAAVFGGLWLARSLRADLDHHLYAQAAIESTSLFDGASGTPHVHAPKLPLAAPGTTTALTAIYDAAGERIASHAALAPARYVGPATGVVATRYFAGAAYRVLAVPAYDLRGRAYTLWLALPLAPVRETLVAYGWGLGGALVLLGGVLSLLQVRFAARLRRRLEQMAEASTRLSDGNWVATACATRHERADELGCLAQALDVASRELQATRATQARFVANAAHELRTPLTVMQTEVDLALRRPRDAAYLQTAMSELRDELARARTLATSLLDLAATQAPGPVRYELVDARELALAVAQALAPLAQARELTVTVDGDGGLVAVDATQLRQALGNVVHNAIKHAPKGSRVALTVAHGAGQVCWRVCDAGAGIAPTLLPTVFEPFVRGTDTLVERGAGLGLALVKAIVDAHGGTVSAVSPVPGEGHGTLVELRVPLVPRRSESGGLRATNRAERKA